MSIDLGFQEPRWVAYPLALHTPRSTPSSLSSLPAPCVLDASVLVPSLPWTLDLFCLHSGLLWFTYSHISASLTRLKHDFDFRGGHSLSYRASPDAAGPTQTPSKRNPALLSLVPAGAWKAFPLSHTLDPTPRPLTIGLPHFPWAQVQEAFTHTPRFNSLPLF